MLMNAISKNREGFLVKNENTPINCCMPDERIMVGYTPITIHINRPKNPSIILDMAMGVDNSLIFTDDSFSSLTSFLFSFKKSSPYLFNVNRKDKFYSFSLYYLGWCSTTPTNKFKLTYQCSNYKYRKMERRVPPKVTPQKVDVLGPNGSGCITSFKN